MQDSTWKNFPTKEEPNNKYKFVSFSVVRDSGLRKISRKVNGIFEWLAEVGGISRAIFTIGDILMGPLSTL